MAKRPGLNLDKLVDAALELIQAEGEHALTLSALAKQLGVKAPSLYNHIDSLADLHRALRLRGLHKLHKELQQACMGRAGYNALLALCHGYREFGQRHQALYNFTLAAADGSDMELNQAGENLLQIVFAILRGYHLEGEDAVHAARCLRSAVHGFVSLENAGGFAMPLSLDRSFEHLIDHLDRTFSEWAA